MNNIDEKPLEEYNIINLWQNCRKAVTQNYRDCKMSASYTLIALPKLVMLFLWVKMMVNEYYTIKEAAEKWNFTERWVRSLCAQGKIKGAVQFGRVWAIPQEATRPVDGRVTTGEYINWRNKQEKK